MLRPTMSNTTTPSDDQLFMTDDLDGRLDPESLTEPKVVHDKGPEPDGDDFYTANNLVWPPPVTTLPDPIKLTLMLKFRSDPSSPSFLEGNLQALSFGHDGWLCTMSTDDKPLVAIALRAAKEGLLAARVMLPEGSIDLHTNLDCTASFSYGAASFTVTADEAHYV